TQTLPVGSEAWDVKIGRNVIYVATDAGIRIISGVPVPPVFDVRRITTTKDGATSAHVSGTPESITAASTTTVIASTSVTSSSATPVANDGSFGPATFSGASGAVVSLTATDAAGRTSTRTVGAIPFANTTDAYAIPRVAGSSPADSMRRIALDGSYVVATNGFSWDESGVSDSVFVFNRNTPFASQTPLHWHASGPIQGMTARNGWAFLGVGPQYDGPFYLETLSLTTGERHHVTAPGNLVNCVTYIDGYAYASGYSVNDDRAILQVYDVHNPAAPQFVSETSFPGPSIWGIQTIDSTHVVGFVEDSNQILIIDISTPAAPALVSTADAGGWALEGAVSGNTLYVIGDPPEGSRAILTIFDITNLAAPQKLSTFTTNGIARGVAPLTPNLIAVADGLPGVTFIDVTNKQNPIILGTQPVKGSPTDIVALDGELFVAAEGAMVRMRVMPSTPNNGAPVFNASLLSQIVVAPNGASYRVTGPVGAVSDPDQPIELTVTNARSGETFIGTAAGNGSFSVPVTGVQGDGFTIFATDSNATRLSSAPINVNGAIPTTATILSLALAPQTITGSSTAAGTIRLSAPASAAVAIRVTSSSTSATVPAYVLVPSGASAEQFNITTTSPASDTTATIVASAGASSQNATLTILSTNASLTNITIDSPSLEGGQLTNAHVILGAAAPASGAVVMLTSSDTSLVSVPASVTVQPGATQATFTIITQRVGANSSASISGFYGASAAATILLTPCPAMTAPPTATLASMTNIWVDDSAPSGSTTSGEGAFTSAQAASGTQSIGFAGTGARHWKVDNYLQNIASNENVVLHALVNPCNPPRQILLTLYQGTTEWRASWGQSRIEPTSAHVRIGPVPRGGEWIRLETLASTLGITGTKTITGFRISIDGGEAWIDRIGTNTCSLATASRPPLANPYETVWVDDDTPAGATVYNNGSVAAWNWQTNQVASGTRSHLESVATGAHQHWFQNATATITPQNGDALFAYVLLDPCNPPTEIVLEWQDAAGSWNHQAFWGTEQKWGTGVAGTASLYRMGPLPQAGEWVRLEVPATAVGLENVDIKGMAFSLVDGQAWFDRAGKVSRVNLALGKAVDQSTTYHQDPYGNFGASYANDGNTAGFFPTIKAATTNGGENQPFWNVDLGSVQPIDDIDVWNVTDQYASYLTNFVVFVSDQPFNGTLIDTTSLGAGVSRYDFPGTPGQTTHFDINRTGRYVRVQLKGNNYLQLAEVEIWAPASSMAVNVAGGGKATQSSTFDTWTQAKFFVNGEANSGYPGNGGVTNGGLMHTLNDSGPPYWQLDLERSVPISTIDLMNRIDGWTTHLTDFYVLVSDAPFVSTNVDAVLAQSGVSAYYFGPTDFVNRSLRIDRTGRFIRIQKRASNGTYLAGSEIRIWSSGPSLAPLSRSPQPTTSNVTEAPAVPPVPQQRPIVRRDR
ncbi:MAG TPA: discoidin domain-containing protein, partial [Thermoanaerobaculia bacterium]|nr:discoidin domain-containing protein [Thermoanaerobaculia bacterium]